MPNISIIIPCSDAYREKYLAKCLESVEYQLIDGDEVIVEPFDYGNENFCRCLNRAIKGSSCDFIIVLGVDDYLYPCLPKLREAIDNSDVYYGKQSVFGKENYIYEPKHQLTAQDFRESNHIAISSMFRKSAWQKIDGYYEFDGITPDDWDFWARLAQNGAKFKYVDTIILEYRTHDEQAWEKIKHQQEEFKLLINERLNSISEHNYSSMGSLHKIS
jgi:glycosyltransferase involved in cell wall biosynthesis